MCNFALDSRSTIFGYGVEDLGRILALAETVTHTCFCNDDLFENQPVFMGQVQELQKLLRKED